MTVTTVATAAAMSNHDSGTETGTDHSPSRFTAVNVNGRDAAPGPSLGTTALPSLPPSHGEPVASPGTRDPPASRESVARGDPDREESQRASPSANKHKRKRSGSGDRELRPASEPSYPAVRGIHHSDDVPLHTNGVRSGSGSVSEIDPANPSTQGPRSDTNETSQPSSNGPWPEYDAQLVSQAQRAQQIDASDAHLADALQREAQGQEPRGLGASRAAVSGSHHVQPTSSPAYPSDRSTAPVQVAPKRKRVFSNRTKTGCMTCRRRKKKCDEMHPACNNCIRGGFLCEGYTSRSTWQKPATTKAPVPLQSKEGYPDISAPYLPETTQHHDRPSTLVEHVDSRKMRPIVVDESERPPQPYNSSPTNSATPHPSASWAKRGWPGPSHPSYVPEHLPKPDYRDVPPIHELPRESHPKPDYPVVPSIRELSQASPSHIPQSHVPPSHITPPHVQSSHAPPSHTQPAHAPPPAPPHAPQSHVQSSHPPPPHAQPSHAPPSHAPPPKPNMPLFHSGVEQRPMPPTPTAPAVPTPVATIDTSSPQAQARMALNIEHQLSGRAINGEETEKDKMIRGELYRPFDMQLVEERDRCKRAVWRFNNASNPLSGLSSKEQNRLLKEILVPPSNSVVNSPSGVAVPRSVGTIGQGTVVEAPFTCYYGYNIQIGEDVMVSQNCLFVDDCGISVGAHTWIGPNVTLLSSMAHSSMQERKGSQSRYQGRRVTIEEDCYLGAGCTIYPGVHLYRGAYVAPGEVVKTDIVAYGFQGYKPSYM
ncbi:hypothetical protein N7462_004170 [Penicillium macrosclerotiorum]|uniref:uncharacterized protein n=1 Tax=Penicillium macrosclerotiorum TaxID=303699 RepID=UPI00254893F2|nr:uncharacterized protein N7462_004170 [Penicillium macrosclerotiorum]KAJ5689778.1 hypothetical protein N7462_004170 [Penicillium macrosclerotiorum]